MFQTKKGSKNAVVTIIVSYEHPLLTLFFFVGSYSKNVSRVLVGNYETVTTALVLHFLIWTSFEFD